MVVLHHCAIEKTHKDFELTPSKKPEIKERKSICTPCLSNTNNALWKHNNIQSYSQIIYMSFWFIAISFRVLKTTSKTLPTTPETPTTPRNESPNRSGLQSSKSENLDKLGPLSPGSVQANPATYAAVEMTVCFFLG